jgi:hypothetical protein
MKTGRDFSEFLTASPRFGMVSDASSSMTRLAAASNGSIDVSWTSLNSCRTSQREKNEERLAGQVPQKWGRTLKAYLCHTKAYNCRNNRQKSFVSVKPRFQGRKALR